MSDITATLEGLRDGSVSTDDAATQFSARQWPVRRAHQPAAYADDLLSRDAAGDDELPPDGSFAEVEAAYAAGWISDEQYARLAVAAAAAIGGDNDDNDLWYHDDDGDNDADGDTWKTAPDMPPAGQENLFPDPGTRESKDAGHVVYERGVQAWPGELKTALSPHEWATGRVEAFHRKQAGIDVPGYTRDDDLLI